MKKELQDYVRDPFNMEVYDALNEKGPWYKLYKEEEYFDLLYERFEIIKKQASKPFDAIEGLRGLSLSEKQYYFLLDCLLHLIYDSAVPVYSKNTLLEFNKTGTYSSLPNYILYDIASIQATPSLSQERKNLLTVFRLLKKEQDKVYEKLAADGEYIKAEIVYPEETEAEHVEENDLSGLTLSKKRGVKTNIVRLLNVLYDLRVFETPNHDYLEKTQLFDAFGKFLGEDFSNHNQMLHDSFKAGQDAHLKIFEELLKVAKSQLEKKAV